MCGFAGVLDPRRRRDAGSTEQVLGAMNDRLALRGPDGHGSWVDAEAGIGLGHRRLSIIDLSEHGSQPMVSGDGRWVLAYNGEIYGFAELADELRAAGVVLRGHSDSEVLLESIALRGVSATLDRIDGMFAFAVWDRAERQLTLARDRMGEKPLCYGHLGSGELVFGSTVDALRGHPEFDRPIDRDALALFFRHKYVPAPFTIHQGLRKLEPGCMLTVQGDGRVGEPTPYWSYFDAIAGTEPFAGSAQDAVEQLDVLLRDSVRRRLVADVPVGAFLSGGIDSSTVVAIAQQVSSEPVRTFTIGSTDADYDESSSARAIAAHLGTQHTELVVDDDHVLDVIGRLGEIYDEPFADSSQVPTRIVSELARRDVTVAISGDAGDELFGGYNRYVWVPAIWRPLSKVPTGARRVGAGALRSVPPTWFDRAAQVVPAQRRPRQLGLKVAKVAAVADAPDPYDVFHRLVSHWQDPTAVVRGSHEPPTMHTDPSRWPVTGDIVEHMAAVDALTYLPDDVLVKVDRATMSVSLEGRVPLLDRSILEFAASLPMSMKIRDGQSKWPLRSVLARYVPRELFERPKAGFGLPIEDWLTGPLRTWAADHLFGPASRAYLHQEPLRRAWQEHQTGRANRAYDLWDAVMFGVWCEHRGITGD